MSGSRLAIACVIAAFAAACAFVPPLEDRLSGEFVEGEGVLIGRGTFSDGTEWTVHARVDRGLLCIFPA